MKITTLIFLFFSFQGIIVQNISAQTPVQWLNYNTSNSSLPTNYLTNIVVDDNNRKWIATDCSGLVMIDESEWQIFNSTNSELPSNCIMSLAIDNNQDLWLGGSSDSFYLARYNGTDWTIWNANNSPLQYDHVNSITFDSTNKIWLQSNNPENFGTDNNLFSFDGDTTWNYELGFTSDNGYP